MLIKFIVKKTSKTEINNTSKVSKTLKLLSIPEKNANIFEKITGGVCEKNVSATNLSNKFIVEVELNKNLFKTW
jgi:hypothetical protein